MEIKFLGHSSFEIKGKEAVVQIDEKNIVVQGGEDPFSIFGPGEYEVGGVRVFGIKGGKTTLYLIEMDDLSLVHLGGLDQKLEHDQVEELNSVDILMVPVGNAEIQLDAEKAAEVVAQLEPYIVLPMHYKESEETKKFDPVEKFLEQMGEENVRREKKLKVTKSSLPEDTEVVVLERVK